MSAFKIAVFTAAAGLAVLAGCARNSPPSPDTAVEEAAIRASTGA